jgi:precorrin-6B methylase 2
VSDVLGAATYRTPVEAYDRHIGRHGRELARALIATAGVRRGGRAVDGGCGPGALTTELAAVLGAGHVAAARSPPRSGATPAR